MSEVRIIEQRENGVVLIELASESLRVIVSNLGCHIISVYAPDRKGVMEDVVLGFEDIEKCGDDGSYMGALVGRVAGRIGNAAFVLNGKEYRLDANNGRNHLHGGFEGFNRKIFGHDIIEDGVRFTYSSPDGEEGYPGNLKLTVCYTLKKDTLILEYTGVSDEDTLINITNHSYFNLSGMREKIYGHYLSIKADRIACADDECLANGDFLDVEGTPFDFRVPHTIGERISDKHEQLLNAGGYDHAFLLHDETEQVILYHEESGRELRISTSLPAVQVYTANFLAGGVNGKQGHPYENRDGVALETQYLPNSINIEANPQVILRKGSEYKAVTSYKFSVRD